jgi:serine/threonine-protein kinase
MGAVYSATDAVLERTVAVKVIRTERVAVRDIAARFRHEARAAASFAHPHVARVYDFGVDRAGRPFLVMELLDGYTLRERLRGLAAWTLRRRCTCSAGLLGGLGRA